LDARGVAQELLVSLPELCSSSRQVALRSSAHGEEVIAALVGVEPPVRLILAAAGLVELVTDCLELGLELAQPPLAVAYPGLELDSRVQGSFQVALQLLESLLPFEELGRLVERVTGASDLVGPVRGTSQAQLRLIVHDVWPRLLRPGAASARGRAPTLSLASFIRRPVAAFPVGGIPDARGYHLAGSGSGGDNVVFADGPFVYLVGVGWSAKAKNTPTRAQLIAAATRLYKRLHGHPPA
jgi:hypothetical protein